MFRQHDGGLEGVWVLKKQLKDNDTRGLEPKEKFLNVLYGISMYLYGNISRFYMKLQSGLELEQVYAACLLNTHMYTLQIMWPVMPLKSELKSGVDVAVDNGLEFGLHRKIRLIESNAKCHFLKKLTCKGTLRQVLYLSEAPSPNLTPYYPLLSHCIHGCSMQYFSHREGGGGRGREKVRGAKVYKAGQKYQHV